MAEKDYMKIALKLAAKADEQTYPNPMVGAVIVKQGKIVGKGYHKKAGTEHAEILAIREASHKCRGATMYVTLEPCNHFGKTPPCTKAVIESGIKKVVISLKDPNPITSGKGIQKLKASGIKVILGKYAEETALLNRKYIKFITTGMPYITLKSAQTLDGKIAARDGSSQWISNENSRKYVKKKRSKYDAILIGTNTLMTDDPFLLDEAKKGYNVCRIIIDSELKISFSSNIIKTSQKAPVIIVATEKALESKINKLNSIKGVEIIRIRSRKGRVPLSTLFKTLAKRGLINILIEGGGEIAGSILEERLLDEVMFFISPKLLGGSYDSVKGIGISHINKALELTDFTIKRFGEDILIRGIVDKAKIKN